jgi:hypothetical protein
MCVGINENNGKGELTYLSNYSGHYFNVQEKRGG